MKNSSKKIEHYPVIVIGGGHAGCEAAASSARMGVKTLLITHRLDTIGEMSCNPAIGGVGKGHLVREIDALDGIMGRAADLGGIQFRMLNRSKGPAVHGPRTQADRMLYKQAVQALLGQYQHLDIKQGAVENLQINQHKVTGIILQDEQIIHADTVILTTGTFLGGMIHIGNKQIPAGRMGENACYGLSKILKDYQFPLGRLKTGTPPRLKASSINWQNLAMQDADAEPVPFSFMTEKLPNRQIQCGITYTNPQTHQIIKDNIGLSAIYSGQISSTGPRYCPSIEDKIVRFADREQHQIFLEPEGLTSNLIYPNGISTALPEEIQTAYIHSIAGLENCEIAQYGYAIEYDYVDPRALNLSLETQAIENLFLAGQINGTTGYEEAAAQGLLAGINAARTASNLEKITLSRTNSYIGVMIDDLTQHGTQEPYRMFTSRAEYRLWLRADNAEERLHDLGLEMNIISTERIEKYQKFYQQLSKGREILNNLTASPSTMQKLNIHVTQDGKKRTAMEWLHQSQISWQVLTQLWTELNDIPHNIKGRLEIDALYGGYLKKQAGDIAIYERDKNITIPKSLIYTKVSGLSNELQQKLTSTQPKSLADAAKISGITPVALLTLLYYIKKHYKNNDSKPVFKKSQRAIDDVSRETLPL